MKKTHYLIAGLAGGLIIGWLSARMTGAEAGPSAGAGETQSIRRAANHSAGGEVRQDRPDAPARRSARTGESRASSPRQEHPADSEIERILQKARESNLSRKQILADARLAELTSRLGLSEQQQAAVRAILEAAGSSENEFGLSSTGDGVAFLSVDGGAPQTSEATNQELMELLTPSQREKFGSVLEEEHENQLELTVYREMRAFQSQVPYLTPQQKDEVFEAFSDIARREELAATTGEAPPTPDERHQTRLEAMGGILTPGQLQVYDSIPRGAPIEGLPIGIIPSREGDE